MKNEKHQPVSQPAVEAKNSSVSITLQLLDKEKKLIKETEKKEAAAEVAKVRCRKIMGVIS